MAVLYKTVQSILANKAGVKVFYPRVVLKGHVSTDQIAREISEYSSLSKGDTKNVIDNLVRVLTTHLQSSESVTLDGFGTFRMAMKTNGPVIARTILYKKPLAHTFSSIRSPWRATSK